MMCYCVKYMCTKFQSDLLRMLITSNILNFVAGSSKMAAEWRHFKWRNTFQNLCPDTYYFSIQFELEIHSTVVQLLYKLIWPF